MVLLVTFSPNIPKSFTSIFPVFGSVLKSVSPVTAVMFRNSTFAAILAYDFPKEVAVVYVLILINHLMYNPDKKCKLIILDVRLHNLRLE